MIKTFLITNLYLIMFAFLNGFVLTKLWAWFIEPTFQTIELKIVPATGIVLIASLLTEGYQKIEEDDIGDFMLFHIRTPLLALLLGWVITWFN